MTWLFGTVALTLAFGLVLIVSGERMRRRRGLGHGRTVELDDRNLCSPRLGLAGRPDRIIEGGIPEEWKSARRVYDSHRAQIATYFLLIEEETDVRTPHGFIVTSDGQRHCVENTPELRAWVLDVAEQIWAVRRQLREVIPVDQPPAKCRVCGQREACGQARGVTGREAGLR